MASSELVAGTVFADHLIVERLGSGGMGTVYKARHPRLPRCVALKVLTAPDGDRRFRARFDREAEVVAQLDHPNIVDVYDRGVEDGTPWVSMRYVSGGDVAQLIQRNRGRLDPRRAVRIIAEAAQGLDYAHERGIVHRDVKPANIFLAEDERVLIGDFGIARTVDPAATVTSGPNVLTPSYAAPEQLVGGPVDGRTDVYALGVTLYELLTGRLPGSRIPAMPLPDRLAAVIDTATAYDPAARYASCGALAAAATAALSKERGWRVTRYAVAALVMGLVVAATAWAVAVPHGIAPPARPALGIVEVPIPGEQPLFCPVPYLKTDGGAIGLCTQFDEPANTGRWGRYFPTTGQWYVATERSYPLLDRTVRIEPQADGSTFVGVGKVTNETTGRTATVGHRYDGAHDNGDMVISEAHAMMMVGPALPVCPADLSKC